MLTALKLFFGSSTGWVVLALGAALTLGSYSYGHTKGYTEGHAKGRTEGYSSRNAEVSRLRDNVVGLTKVINDDRDAANKKIKDVEAKAADAAVETAKRLGTQLRQRDQIIAGYKATVKPETQQHCGLSIETVKTINELIKNVNEESNETPAVSVGSASGISNDLVDSAGATRTTSSVGDDSGTR